MAMQQLLLGMMLLLVLGCASDAAARSTLRSLQAFPQPLPAPFAFPKDIANAARSSRGAPNALAISMCDSFARKDLQASREFRDIDGAKIFPMMANVAKAAYVYPDVAGDVGGMLAKCNEMGGEAAQGVGYGMAYVFSKGMVQAGGMVAALEAAYDKAGGCSSVNNILDVAAAVIKYRDVALDELHLAMKTYSTKLAACTPRDDQQVYRAYGGRDPIHARHAGEGVPQDPAAWNLQQAAPAPAPAYTPPAKREVHPHDPKHLLFIEKLVPNVDPKKVFEHGKKEDPMYGLRYPKRMA